jgi:medium-chain acyl-[acyl-carrier-protein] hydrolase
MPTGGFQPVSPGTADIHHVKYSDLDQNRHVNNARYVEWILDLIGYEMLKKIHLPFSPLNINKR